MKKRKMLSILLLLIIVYLLTVRLFLIYSYSIDLDGLEFAYLRYALPLLDGNPIYMDATKFPYFPCLLVPVYLYSLKLIFTIFNVSYPNDIHTIYIISRWFSFIFVVLQMIVLIFFFRKRLKASYNIILFLLTLYLLLITGHMYVVRPDAMKLFFFILAFISLIEFAFFGAKKRYLILFFSFSVLDIYIKQDSLIYLSLCVLTLFFIKRNKIYLYILFCLYLLTLLVFLLFQSIFGSHFFSNIFFFNLQKIDSPLLSFNIWFILFSSARILPIVLIGILLFWKSKEQLLKNELIVYMLTLFTVLFGFSHLLMLRAGSYINYSYECILILIFLLFAISRSIKNVNIHKKIKMSIVAYTIFIIISNVFIHNYTYNFKRERELKNEYYTLVDDIDKIKDIVEDDKLFSPNPKYVLFMLDKQLIYGYDYNIGRMMEVYLSISLNSKLLCFNSKEYDNSFKNGTIKYIINETNKEYFVRKYYPEYQFYKKVGKLTVYQFENKDE